MSVCLSGNREVKARKQHECNHCFEPIPVGAIYITRSGVEPGEGFWRYNAHPECEKATANWNLIDWEIAQGVRHKRGTEEEA